MVPSIISISTWIFTGNISNAQHAVVIGGACIALIHTALIFTLLGTILYFAHSRLQNVHVRCERAADQAPAADDGNIQGSDEADHAPAADDGNVEGSDAADHPPAVDGRNLEGTDDADHPPAVHDGSLEGTDTGPDSTTRISWEDKGKGVDLREYGPLMLDGSLWMGSFTQCIVQGPNDKMFHPHISPKANTTIHPKSQTAGDDGSAIFVTCLMSISHVPHV
ncbi:hypothetical protein BU17DRAFT_83641 [Hysterangium stoloniferum]|nr:hypothetical protein BU17DRAFT_83641 [Hysterangium stoloniferum]